MKITFETGGGIFVAYLTMDGQISIFSGDENLPVAVISPLFKRNPQPDLSADAVMRAVLSWLRQSSPRVEVDCVTAGITSP